MFETQRRRSFPLPDYDFSDPGQVTVTLGGRVLDERYTRLLMERTDLDLRQVMLLDQVQKGRKIDREAHRRLKTAGLVEGRYPDLIVAGAVARAAGDAGRHIRERGFDKQYYLDLILALAQLARPFGWMVSTRIGSLKSALVRSWPGWNGVELTIKFPLALARSRPQPRPQAPHR